MPRNRYFQDLPMIKNGQHTVDHSGNCPGIRVKYPRFKKKQIEAGKVPQVGTEPNPPAMGKFVLRSLGRRMEWRKF